MKAAELGNAPSLAVLPFANRSGLEEDEVFAIGMVEDVIDALSQGAFVRVISSAATSGFRKGAIIDLPAVGRQLGVGYILEGNVRRTGTSLRVTAQLVEASNGTILWTARFDRPLSELATLQEDLVREVAGHLDAQVYGLEMRRALRKPSDLTAWEAAMLSLHHAKQQITTANVALALDEARRAIAIAPDYGLAHAILAHLSALRYLISSPDDAAEIDRVLTTVGRALTLDPENAAVMTYVAYALNFIGRPQEALRHIDHALRVSPRMADAIHARGIACTLLDRSDEALASFETDLQAAPGAVTNQLNFAWRGVAHARAGRSAEAIQAFDRSLALYPDYPMVLAMRSVLCAQDGRLAEAQTLFARARRLEMTLPLTLWELGLCRYYAGSRHLDGILQTTRQLWTEAGSWFVPPTVIESIRSVGWPTPTGTLWPSLPQVPTPSSSFRSLPTIDTRVSTSGPLPISVAPLMGRVSLPFSMR